MSMPDMGGPQPEIQKLLNDLRSSEWRVRAAGARSVAPYIGDDRAMSTLVELLSDPDTAVVEAAVHTLVVSGGERGIVPVLAAFADSPDDIGYHIRDALVDIWMNGFALEEMCKNVLAERSPGSATRGALEVLATLSGHESDI
jgi:HEAT repeat protein